MDLLNATVKNIKAVNGEWSDMAQKHLDNLTKPLGSLGRLEEFARRLVAMTENKKPMLDKKVIFTFAGDHGVTEEGVSAFPKEVTQQMVLNFLRGGAGINVLARHAGADVIVVDIGVDFDWGLSQDLRANNPPIPPLVKGGKGGFESGLSPYTAFISKKVINGTKNFAKEPAMTRKEAIKCMETGIELANGYAKKGFKLFGTGDMGIGNTTPSSAIAAVLTGRPVSEVTGKGTGITDESLQNKIKVIKKGIELNKPNPEDAIDVLSKVGGAEIGGIAGLILGAASNRIPVVIDGFISTTGALIAYCIEPKVKDYMFAAHNSVEIGHKAILEKIGLEPILDLNLRLGEGTGAALAMLMIEAGLKIYKEMATFGEAGVSSESKN